MKARTLIPALCSLLASTVLSASGASVEPARKSAPRLELTSLNGTVQIRHARSVQAYSKGSPMPVEIPVGSEVTVRGAKAEFRGMGVIVRGASGDVFSYDLVDGDNGNLAVHIAALGDETAMEVVVGESSTILVDGDAIAVTEPAAGRHEVRVLAGAPAFLSPVRDVALGPGQVWQWPPLVRVAIGPAPGEVLRSAVGPKPAVPPPAPLVRPGPSAGPLDLGTLLPLRPEEPWRLGVHGEACRVGGGWACEESPRWGRRIDLPAW